MSSFNALRDLLSEIKTTDEVLDRQVRIISIFLKDEKECRANVAIFHHFAFRCEEWARRVQETGLVKDIDGLMQLQTFIEKWLQFIFI